MSDKRRMSMQVVSTTTIAFTHGPKHNSAPPSAQRRATIHATDRKASLSTNWMVGGDRKGSIASNLSTDSRRKSASMLFLLIFNCLFHYYKSRLEFCIYKLH